MSPTNRKLTAPAPLKPRFNDSLVYEAGVDEAGRGCLAGPVTAAACILPKDFYHPLLNDSKQLTHEQREAARLVIEKEAITWAIASCTPAEVDEINILQASFTAMHKAIDGLSIKPELLLIDGNRFRPYFGMLHQCIVKGDSLYLSIAAASILAKTERDRIMEALHQSYPQYGWAGNKGYPTKEHRDAIRAHGTCEQHRMTFRLLPE